MEAYDFFAAKLKIKIIKTQRIIQSVINIHRYKPNICRSVSVAGDFLKNIYIFIFISIKREFLNTVASIFLCSCMYFCSVHPNGSKNRMLLQIIVGIKIAIVQYFLFFTFSNSVRILNL